MKKRTIATVVVGAVLATGAAGGAVALASGSGDDHESSAHEGSATGPDAERAVAAALASTGGGKVNSVERESEHGAVWDVEVVTPDGSTVDVRLDGNLHVVAAEADRETEAR
jgi:uncharacterized membrane protein YkoI